MLGEVPTVQPELSGDFGTLMGWADKVRRLRVRDQRRDPRRRPGRARVRRGGHRPVPHRTYVLRAVADDRGAPDDPGRKTRPGGARRWRQAAARAARRLRRDFPDHGRAAGDDPPARSAAARIPAARARRSSRRSRRRPASTVDTLQAAARASCTSSTRCSAIAAAGSASPIPKSTRCRRAPSSKRRSTSRARARPPVPEVMVPLVATRAELSIIKALIDRAAQTVFARGGDADRLSGRHHDRAAPRRAAGRRHRRGRANSSRSAPTI